MSNMDTAVDLLYAYDELYQFIVKLESVGVEIEQMSITADAIVDAILDLIGIPNNGDDFARDWYYEEVMGFDSDVVDPEIFLQGVANQYKESLKNESHS